MKFDLSQYATVEERLTQFWSDHPDGAIITEIAHREENIIVFKAYIYFERGGDLVSTGFAEEVRDASPVNRTSFVENAETSAIGRGLANANYAMKKRPSREEMQKAQRATTSTSTSTNVAVDNSSDLMSDAQRGTLGKLVIDLKLNKKFVPYAKKKIGRDITSVDEITKAEATMLIAAMIREKTESEESE
jgi:hypothetical protein